MTIPRQLIEQIRHGRVVLFFGSGALYGAELPGKDIPLGNDLRDILVDQYLNESFSGSDLAHVAAMAISQSSLFDVQDFIRDYISGLLPAEFHKLIPLFKWRALFTTNYDLLIETSYLQVDERVQELSVILSNEDRLDETRLTNDKLPFLKLHGCVTRTHDSSLPLILTTDQYNDCLRHRDRLFTHLYELAYENTVVFVGHSLLDHNIRTILLKLEKEAPHGQRHYLIKPGVDAIERDFWAEKRITALDISFESFMGETIQQITQTERLLSLVRPPVEHPIQSIFNKHVSPSVELVDFLSNKVEWVVPNISTSYGDPKDFFKGMDQGWFPIVEGFPISRAIQLKIFERVFELAEAEREKKADFFVFKGEAGAGKTILMRQLAWEACNKSVGVVLWVREGCEADLELVDELVSKTNERVYLFWDNAAVNAAEMYRFVVKAQRNKTKITIISSERYNEWNVRCEELDELVTGRYKLTYLSELEIDQLVTKLDECNSLGPNLENKNHEERCKELKDIHGRQLLVALHEATMGEPFEDIVFNEYESIIPKEAKKIYLTVCTLNRIKIPVRAGLISRIYNISFSDFQSRLYRPLEKVVIAKGASDQDIHYTARHSEIAQIVFRRALSNVEDRYQEYINIIDKLNISFSSDRSSFRSLIKAKSLYELFPDYADVAAIYKTAHDAIGDDPYLFQQMANYERIRPNGNLDKALELLEQAKQGAPNDRSILHSLNVVWRDKAAKSEDPHERRKCRSEARGYLDRSISKWGLTSYVSASKIELSIDSLTELLNDQDSTQVSIRDAIRKLQSEITENKQKYPSDGRLHMLEAQFASLINDHKRALSALEKSFEENDREPSLAIRLSSSYMDDGNFENARDILTKALERRRSDHRLNYHLAELLRNRMLSDMDELMYFYRRGFTPGDRNYQAQFWYARYAFNSIDRNAHESSMEIFEGLRQARLSHDSKIKIRDYDGGGQNPKPYYGVINRKRLGFGFIKADGTGYEIFFPEKSVKDGMLDAMREGDRVCFNLGFTFNGPVACNISC